MNIFKFLLPLLYLFLTNEISAQYILSQQVISNSGGSINMAGITMDYTAGESFTSDIKNSNYSINQGFHQYFTSTISTDKVENNSFKFFPNPVTGVCYLEFEKPVTESSTVLIYNSAGMIIYNKYIDNSDLIQLDLSHLLPGNYITVLSDNKNKNISSFKLIKI